MFKSVNHPVHFITKGNERFPSALIPFCEFGGNMSSVGIKVKEFNAPVCNSFETKVLNDQLCYEMDLAKYSNKDNIHQELKSGLVFMMDYNQDRQVSFDEEDHEEYRFGLINRMLKPKDNQHVHARFYLNTIGKIYSLHILLS